MLEIGYRLSQNTSINLSNKTRPFSISKIKSVIDSFNPYTTDIFYYSNGVISPRYYAQFEKYRQDLFVFRGELDSDEDLIEGGYAHTWISTGFDDYSYDIVELTSNRFLNPNHPDPYGYTETSRETVHDFMLYMNWGYDGISNGWFHSGCFDMSERIEDGAVSGGYTPKYDYNFIDITYFSVLQFPTIQ